MRTRSPYAHLVQVSEHADHGWGLWPLGVSWLGLHAMNQAGGVDHAEDGPVILQIALEPNLAKPFDRLIGIPLNPIERAGQCEPRTFGQL